MALLLPHFTVSGGAAAPAGMPVGQWLQPTQGRVVGREATGGSGEKSSPPIT